MAEGSTVSTQTCDLNAVCSCSHWAHLSSPTLPADRKKTPKGPAQEALTIGEHGQDVSSEMDTNPINRREHLRSKGILRENL